MNFRIIILLSWFLVTGCVSDYLISDVKLQARSHMAVAKAKQDSSNIVDAIKEYTLIYEKYRDTNYLKPAVWKLALLNIHPNNPDINYAAAQDWLQIYSKLHLSSKEEEIAQILTILIQQTYLILNEKEKLISLIKQQKNKIAILTAKLEQAKSDASKIKNRLNESEAQLLILNKNLTTLNNKLQKLKEIDVQMHKTRKKNSAPPLKSN
ncbi:MAG: hypothetical protein GY857_01685 [Desulfobacula sp.]|nr:hypothetical protein [Desulfobacula sp.]